VVTLLAHPLPGQPTPEATEVEPQRLGQRSTEASAPVLRAARWRLEARDSARDSLEPSAGGTSEVITELARHRESEFRGQWSRYSLTRCRFNGAAARGGVWCGAGRSLMSTAVPRRPGRNLVFIVALEGDWVAQVASLLHPRGGTSSYVQRCRCIPLATRCRLRASLSAAGSSAHFAWIFSGDAARLLRCAADWYSGE